MREKRRRAGALQKWGLIGCGDIARKRVAPALRDSVNSELVAVSRFNKDLLESFAREFGARKTYSDWRELVRDEQLDAIYIATPVHLHSEQTVAAAEAGKHVLCEKPLALNVAECDEMIAACRANNVKLGVAYYRHFYPVVHRTKEIIASGEIGVPIIAQINAFEWFNPEPGHPREWLLQPQMAGGGPMFDFGCHRIEVLLDIFGSITDVQSSLGNVLFDRKVEDVAVALLRFENGVRANLTVTHAVVEPQDTLDIYCSRGSIHLPVLNKGTMRVATEDGERVEQHPSAPNIHQPLVEDFISSIEKDRSPLVSGEIGREVAKVIERVYQRR